MKHLRMRVPEMNGNVKDLCNNSIVTLDLLFKGMLGYTTSLEIVSEQTFDMSHVMEFPFDPLKLLTKTSGICIRNFKVTAHLLEFTILVPKHSLKFRELTT